MGHDESSAPKRPKVQNKQVWASLRQTPTEVIAEMFAGAERRGPKHERTCLLLVDGQEAQQREPCRLPTCLLCRTIRNAGPLFPQGAPDACCRSLGVDGRFKRGMALRIKMSCWLVCGLIPP